MAYIVQNSVTTYTGNSNSVDVEIPDIANVQVGDYIVFFGTIANSITWSASGYTNVGASNGGNVGVSWLYKKVTTLPETDPTITMSASQVYEVVGFVVRDADPDDFIDNNQTNLYSSNTTSLEIPSISASNDQSLLVAGVSCRNSTGRQFSEEWMNVAYPGVHDLIVVSTFQENSGMTPLVDVTHTANDRGSASLIAIKNKTGGARAVNISGGPEWFMRGLDGLSDPVSLDTRRSTINGKTVGATINLSVSNSRTSGEDGADFYTPSGIDLVVAAGGSGVVGEQNGVVFNISGGHDFSGDSLTFTYYLSNLDNNFQDDVGLYLEDNSGNWAVRKLFDQEDGSMSSVNEIYTHYGSFDTNTDVYPVLDISGAPDYSNITWWGLTWENRITNTSTRTHVLKNFGHANNPLIFTGGGAGDGTDGASITPRIITSGVASGSKRRAVAYQGLGQDVVSESVQIGDGVNPTYYYAPFTSLEFQQVGGFVGFGFRRDDRTMEFRIKTSPSDTIDFSSSTISTPSPQDFIIDPSSSISATYNFNGFTISGFYITWLSGVTCNSASFIGCYDIDGKGGTFNRSVFSGSKSTTSALTVNSGAETTNCVFTKNDETYAIEIQDAGTYDLNGNTYSGYTKDLNVTAGSGTVTITLESSDSIPTFDTAGATVDIQIVGVVEVVDGATYTANADKFLVDTTGDPTFTISGFIPTEIEHTGTGTATILGTDNAKLVGTTITDSGGTLTLGDGLSPSVNWAENVGGETITLTNAETSLDGLRGLALVDYDRQGTYTTYTLSGRLILDGDLIIDPDVEKLVFTSTAPYPNLDYRGVLQVGKKTINGSLVKYSSGDAIVVNRRAPNGYSSITSGGVVATLDGSSFIGYGGRIITASPLSFCGDSGNGKTGSVLIESLEIFARRTDNSTKPDAAEDSAQIRFDNVSGENVVVSGLTINGELAPSDPGRGIFLFATDYTSFSAKVVASTFQSFASAPKGIRLDDMEFLNNFRNFDIASNGGGEVMALVNSDTGSSSAIQVINGDPNHFAFFGDALINVKNASGTNLSGTKYHIEDVNDGYRYAPIGTTTSISSLMSSYGISGTNIYSGTTDGSGNASETILLSTYSRTDSEKVSDYSNGGSLSDIMDVLTYKYGYGVGSSNPVLRTVGGTPVNIILSQDLSITESTKSTVDAYTSLNTAQQFYDRACAYLEDNYAGETSTLVSRNGDVINAGSYNVIIDGTGVPAINAFTVVGNTMTIHASTFTGGITTTGTITITNSALLDGGVF